MSGDVLETRTYLCTGCPLGCRLEVDARDGDIVEVRGFACRRGERYAEQEHRDPRRPLATSVAITGALLPRLPVRTREPIPKPLVRDAVRALRAVVVAAPMSRGDVVVADLLGTGIDVIATRSMEVVARRTTPHRSQPRRPGRHPGESDGLDAADSERHG